MPVFSKHFETFLTVGFWACVLAMVHSYVVYPLLSRLVCRWLLPRPGRQLPTPDLADERSARDRAGKVGRLSLRKRCVERCFRGAKDDTQATLDPWPPVSVLVPAHNEATVIAAKIENFLALDYPADRMELLIFDDGSVDETVAIAEQAIAAASAKSAACPSMRLIRRETRSGKATAVNALGDEAQHDLWLLTDANVIMDRDALKHLAARLIDPQVGAATGPVVLVGSSESFQQGEVLYYQIERSIQSAESFTASVMGVDGGMYLVRGPQVPKLPGDTILDDFTVSMAVMRQGQRIVYCEQAYATECGTVSARQEYRRRVRIAAGAVQLVGRGWLPKVNQPWLWFQFISHKLIRWMSPLLLMTGSLAMVGLGLFSDPAENPGFRWATAFGLSVSVVAVAVTLIPTLQRSAIGSVIHYLVLSQVAIGVGLIKGVFHMQPPQWEKADRAMDSSQ